MIYCHFNFLFAVRVAISEAVSGRGAEDFASEESRIIALKQYGLARNYRSALRRKPMAQRTVTAEKKASITSKPVHLDFYAYTTNDLQQHWDVTAKLPPDKRDEAIVVGGGGWADFHPSGGAFLTGSCPTADLDGWEVASKDHAEVVDAHQLSVYLLALRIDGMRRPDLSRLVQRFSQPVEAGSGPVQAHPEATVMVPNTHTVLSGGFWVDWHGEGNLATASVPVFKPGMDWHGEGNLATASVPVFKPGTSVAIGWTAKSKDHLKGSPATITAYAVGIKSMLPGAVSVAQHVIRGVSTTPAAHPTMGVPVGYALDSVIWLGTVLLTGAGAEVHWTRAGNMLTRIQPFVDDKLLQTVDASAKDHKESDPSKITVYAVGASFYTLFDADRLADYVGDLTKAGV
jgi:hypothetical protein